MRNTTRIAAILIGLVLTVTTIAAAQGMGMGGMQGNRNMQQKGRGQGRVGGGNFLAKIVQNKKVVEELGLTETQVSSITSISETATTETESLREQMKTLRTELKELVKADNPNISKIDANIDKTGDLMTRLQKIKVHSMIDAINVLTEEQKEKVKNFMETRNRNGKGQRGRNRGSGMRQGYGKGGGMFGTDE